VYQITVERRKRGWTQAELGLRAGIDTPTINRLENGAIKPYPGWKKKLSMALGVAENVLFQEVPSYAADTADN